MTKTEAQRAFPLGSLVVTPSGDGGKVAGHLTYNLAFVGLRTFVEVQRADGSPLGEFAPASLTFVSLP